MPKGWEASFQDTKEREFPDSCYNLLLFRTTMAQGLLEAYYSLFSDQFLI